MKIIADIGSTHSKWMILQDDHLSRFIRDGFNPFIQSDGDFQALLFSLPVNNKDAVDIHLYGAGFVSENAETLKTIARTVFKNADTITIESNLLGACRAMADNQEAIVVTIGTGANHCHYDGEKIIQSLPALGYILGDEGGGVSIGKALLKKAARKQLSPEIQKTFENTYGNNIAEILSQTYLQEKTASYLAGFAYFAEAHDDDPAVKAILDDNFKALADNLISYNRPDLPHYFTGSIARHFHGYITAMCQSMGVKTFKIIDDILEPLAAHHADNREITQIQDKAPVSPLANLSTEALSHYNNLDQMDIGEIIANINSEDQTVAQSVRRKLPQIESLIGGVVTAMESGGRLFYLGAGTSGRLGIVDASECPPTFGVDHHQVIALIAGGDHAIRKAVEGAEDNKTLAWKNMAYHNPTDKDFVIGIAASGCTPYVIGGLAKAKKHGLKTGCIVCNENSEIASMVDYPVEIVTGAEFLTGSTRMKAGTAQKLVLNMVSTATMIRLGHVKGNMMIDMKLSNDKLMERAVRMVCAMADVDAKTARDLLEEHGSVRKVIEMYKIHSS